MAMIARRGSPSAPTGESGHAEMRGLRHTSGAVNRLAGPTATFAVHVRAPSKSSVWRCGNPKPMPRISASTF